MTRDFTSFLIVFQPYQDNGSCLRSERLSPEAGLALWAASPADKRLTGSYQQKENFRNSLKSPDYLFVCLCLC